MSRTSSSSQAHWLLKAAWICGIIGAITMLLAQSLLASWPHRQTLYQAPTQRQVAAVLTNAQPYTGPHGQKGIEIFYTLGYRGTSPIKGVSPNRVRLSTDPDDVAKFLGAKPGLQFTVWQRLDNGSTSSAPWPQESQTVRTRYRSNPTATRISLIVVAVTVVLLICYRISNRRRSKPTPTPPMS